MKKQYWIGLVAMVAVAVGVGRSFAEEEGAKAVGMGEQMPAWMAKTEHHASMVESVGEFDIATEMIMMPDTPPVKGTAVAKREMILNGFYVQESFSMDMGNMKYHGRLTMGYDTIRKEYVSTWIDNWSPVMSVSRGTEKDGVITFHGEDPDHMTGKLKKTKRVVKVAGPDSWVMTFYDVTDKGDVMTMRMAYTRKK